MQDLLHWAHKLALYGLVKLGCVYNFDYMKKLLQILRENRLEKGISQEYLAGKLGISSSTISRWESKGNFPSTDKLFEYASFLNLSCYDVLALLANEQPRPVGRIEISAYNKATFNRLVDLLLKGKNRPKICEYAVITERRKRLFSECLYIARIA